ncbi:MAG: hypothetical protein D6678_00645 [Zetaproteobacteria bacterium]|nr:MAG: hypothetical protein D6678_00645 [Zetaproteobacteria bacterium]
MSRVHHYPGRSVLVEFELARCIHTGDCTRMLPSVFDTKRHGRWVQPDEAPKADVIRVCAACPTGALRARDPQDGTLLHAVPTENTVQPTVNGPLYVTGNMVVNGHAEPAYRAAFCRCGASGRMPYCDESHRQAKFSDPGTVSTPLPSPTTAHEPLDIQWSQGGPLIIRGPFTLLDSRGKQMCTSAGATFCCCGRSRQKPYCDGSHRMAGGREHL